MSKLSESEIASLIEEVRNGGHAAFGTIAKEFSPMLQSMVYKLDVPAHEKDDLYQEGLIGLYKAVLFYNEKYSSFFTFAHICAKRNILTALRSYLSKKNLALRTSVSIEDSAQSEYMLCNESLSLGSDPEHMLVNKEQFEAFMKKKDECLSDYEKQVLKYFLKGLPYEKIASLLGKTPKSIDNAIQRIRNKLKLLVY